MSLLDRLWTSLETRPWTWTAVMFAPLIFLPQIDLTITSWFFDPRHNVFPARSMPAYEWVRKVMPAFMFAGAGYIVVLWAAAEWLKQPVMGVTRRVAAYLLASLALGPGLIVNFLLKENWGRPRPSMVREFGGPDYYVPPLVISGQCDGNCSFSSGHGALGFWPVAFALLAPPAWRKPALAAALLFAAMVGFVRIAQGGHFFSDVVFSGIVVVGSVIWLKRRILGDDSEPSQKNNV